jgi:hypothetical protein
MFKICPRIDFWPKRLSHLLPYALVALSALVLMAPFPSPHAHAAQVELAWDPSLGPDLMGYKVYYGTATGSYSYAVDVGPSTGCLVSGLLDDMTYYFATTAYNSFKIESVFSNEVSHVTRAPSDTTPPTVSSTNPANGATGVSVRTAIRAIFSEAMDPATITTATFTVSAGSTYISGTVSYSGTTATFTPSRPLAYDTTYTATITAGARDLAGNAMPSSYVWTFFTQSRKNKR